MKSAAYAFSSRCIGVIMTGMGNDGVEGLSAIKRAGGKTVAQNESTSVVFGMPKSAIEAGVIDYVVELHRIPETITRLI
jgi:two-component system chemotaxis response regulator CheB